MSETQWRTHRLELDDQTLREWDAAVLAADPDGIVLDTSAFYPGGGGQPPDHGVLLWGGVQTRIAGARKGDDLYLIPAEGDPLPPPGTAVRGAVEDERRTALMRTHSGLHVLCGVVFRDFGALVTGGNMEPLTARMDFNLPQVPEGFRDAVESACNAEVAADRRIDIRVLPRQEAFSPTPGHHPHRHQPGPGRGQGGPHHRHRRAGPAGGRRYARGRHRPGRPDRGGEDREQGQGVPQAEDPDR